MRLRMDPPLFNGSGQESHTRPGQTDPRTRARTGAELSPPPRAAGDYSEGPCRVPEEFTVWGEPARRGAV
jgi:hypothetical protein